MRENLEQQINSEDTNPAQETRTEAAQDTEEGECDYCKGSGCCNFCKRGRDQIAKKPKPTFNWRKLKPKKAA